MEAKQKAKALIDTFTFASIYFTNGMEGAKINAKSCAELAVDELIKAHEEISKQESGTTLIDFGQGFWQEVKKELIKL